MNALKLVAVAALFAAGGCVQSEPESSPVGVQPAASVSVQRESESVPAPIDEDDPQFNCLTMGNGVCGPEWVPLPETVYPALPGVSDDEGCLWRVADTTFIVCSDGQVFES